VEGDLHGGISRSREKEPGSYSEAEEGGKTSFPFLERLPILVVPPNLEETVSEKVAVVTGGAGALGEGVVRALLDEGWQVHVPLRREADEGPFRREMGDPPSLSTVAADLTDPASVEQLFASVDARSGRLDLLCNLVGGFAMGPVEETDPETWQRMVGLNATAPFLAIRAAVPRLRASGGGAVVNVAAAAALGAPVSGMSAYLASKSAVIGLTRNLAEELADDGTTVNAVAPTVIDTPANRDAMPEADPGGWLTPEEIARVILFLAGPDARIVTGNVVALRKG